MPSVVALVADLKRVRRGHGLRTSASLRDAPVVRQLVTDLTPSSIGDNDHETVSERARDLLRSHLARLDDALNSRCARVALNLDGDLRRLGGRRRALASEIGKSERQIQRNEDAVFEGLAEKLRDSHLTWRRRQLERPTTGPEARKGIAVLAPLTSWSTDYYTDICRAIREAADRERRSLSRDVIIIDIPLDGAPEAAAALTKPLLHNVAGIISINIALNSGLLDRCGSLGVPVVSVTHHEIHPACAASILPDHAGFAELLRSTLEKRDVGAAVLLTKGTFNPLKSAPIDPFREEKRHLFSEVSKSIGSDDAIVIHPSTMNPHRVRRGDSLIIEVPEYTLTEGRRACHSLALEKTYSTAIVALADVVAIGYNVELLTNGTELRAAMVRLTGFDNTPYSDILNLTSVDYRLHQVGRSAYDRLQEAIDNMPSAQAVESVRSEFVPRASSTW